MTALDRVLDTRPLRSDARFRRLWIGTTTAMLGQQIAVVTVLLQVWRLTGSTIWVGAIGLAHAVPLVVGGVVGGSLADAVDRRRLVVLTTVGGIAGSSGLAVQAVLDLGSLPVVLGLVAVQATCSGLGAPARRTFVPRLLPRDQIAAGIALTHVGFQTALLVGPAAGGVIAADRGVAVCYLVNAAATCVALYGVARLPAMPAADGVARAGVGAIVDGWRFVAHRPVLRGAFATDLAATLLAMPVALFPAVNEARFGGDPAVLGWLLSAVAVGGVTAGLTSGSVTRATRPGIVSLVAAATWGVALAGFGLVTSLWSTLTLLAVAGAADTVSVISRGTIVQLATPDSHRGRVSAVEHAIGAAGPDLGDFRAGLVGGLTSPTVALVSGGLLCVLGVAAVAARVPSLRRFDPAHDGVDEVTHRG